MMAEQHSTLGRRVTKSRVCHERHLKVRRGNVSHIIKDKHHSHFDQTLYFTVPWINIQGQWLQQAGFEINTPIKVRVMDGCLVLTAES
ncbi:MAG: type I toxin-antitoxin system SymE family toxin [Ectothiorhodospiraceae bacterium]|nr:type I toxin-antitoxin system SymE family toxin [Ectothiorhodospiraceae bacterium]